MAHPTPPPGSVGMDLDDSSLSFAAPLPTFEHLNAQLIARGYLKAPLRLEGMDASQRATFVDMLHLMLSQRTEDMELREAMLAKNRLVGTMLEKAKREREQMMTQCLEAQRKVELVSASNANLTTENNALKRALVGARSEVTTVRNQLKTLRAASNTARIAAERSNSVVRAHYAEATLAASRGVFPSLDVVPCAFARTGPAPEQSKRSATAEIEGIAARRLDENRSLRRLASESINGVRAAAHTLQQTLPGKQGLAAPASLGVRDLFYVSASLAGSTTPFYSLADAKHPAPLALTRANKAIVTSAAALHLTRTREASKHNEDLAKANIAVSDRAAEAALRDYLALNPLASSVRGGGGGKGAMPATDEAGRLRPQEPSMAEMERKLVAALTRAQELEAENAALLSAGFSTEPAPAAPSDVPASASDAATEALEAQRRELQERMEAADVAADAAQLERRRLEAERKALEEQRRKEQMDAAKADKKIAGSLPRVVRLVAPGAMEEEAAFNLARSRGDFLHITKPALPVRADAASHTRVRAAQADAAGDASTSSRRSRFSVGNTSTSSSASSASNAPSAARSSRSQVTYGLVAHDEDTVIYGPLPPRLRRRSPRTSASASASASVGESSIASTGTRSRSRAAAAAAATSISGASASRDSLTSSERNIAANVEHMRAREDESEAEPIPARLREQLGLVAPQQQQPREEVVQQQREPEAEPAEQQQQQQQRPVDIFDVNHNVAELLRQLNNGPSSSSSASARQSATAPAEPSSSTSATNDVQMHDGRSSSTRKRSYEALEPSSASSEAPRRVKRTSSEHPTSKPTKEPQHARSRTAAVAGAGVGAPTASSLARAAEAKATREAKAQNTRLKGTPGMGRLLKSAAASSTSSAAAAAAGASASAGSRMAARKKPRLALGAASEGANAEQLEKAKGARSAAMGKGTAEHENVDGMRPMARRVREGRV